MTYASTTRRPRPALGGSLIALSLLFTWGSYVVLMALMFELVRIDHILSGDLGRNVSAVLFTLWVTAEHIAWCIGIHLFTERLPGMRPHNALRWTARVGGHLNAFAMILVALCFLFASLTSNSPGSYAAFFIIVSVFATFGVFIFRAVATIGLGLWMIRFADALGRPAYRTQTWIITLWYGIGLTFLAGLPLIGLLAQFMRSSLPSFYDSFFDGPTLPIIYFCFIGFPLPYVAVFLFLLSRQAPNIPTYQGAFPLSPEAFAPVITNDPPPAP